MAEISLNKYFMDIAEIVKNRSTCLRRKVGVVFVLDGRIVSTGYNGAPSKVKHCDSGGQGCTMVGGHCVRALHAEMNGILNASQSGQSLKGSTLYTVTHPCIRCLMSLRNSGVANIVYREEYVSGTHDPLTKEEKDLLDELVNLFKWVKYDG